MGLTSPTAPSPWPCMSRTTSGLGNLACVDRWGERSKYECSPCGFPSSNPIHQGPFSWACAKCTRGLTIGEIRWVPRGVEQTPRPSSERSAQPVAEATPASVFFSVSLVGGRRQPQERPADHHREIPQPSKRAHFGESQTHGWSGTPSEVILPV